MQNLRVLSITIGAFFIVSILSHTAFAQGGGANITIITDTISIPTYPCDTSLQYNDTFGISYFKRVDCAGVAVSQTYTRLNLENNFLRVSLLPELGGRVYEMIFKPTGHNELYQNPVIKPTPWGPPEQGYWLAPGGIEWGLPVPEHGYEWGVPWTYSIIERTDGIIVTLRDSTPDAPRLRAAVSVHLPVDSARLRITHRLENGRGNPLDFSYWTNAMLAPGAPNTPTENLRFIIPADFAQVHSCGSAPAGVTLPGEKGVMPWHIVDGYDMSRLGNWNGWLGFFAYPQARNGFSGVYDSALDEGMMHIFPADVAVGSKAFAFGWEHPIDWHNWTDDGSGYVELHNGPQPTFWNTTHLDNDESLTYSDIWYPVSGLGNIGVDTRFAATDAAVLALTPTATGFDAGLFSPIPLQNVRAVFRRWDFSGSFGTLLLVDERIFDELSPTMPHQWSIDAAGLTLDDISLMVFDENDTLLAAINPYYSSAPLTPRIWLPLILKQ